VFTFTSKLLKIGYGFDTSGEVMEGGGTSGKDMDLEETQEPWTHHQTGPNPVNVSIDSVAEEEFPAIKHKSNVFPATRSR